MKKFNVKFLREFEVEVEAETGHMARKQILALSPQGSVKLLSIIAEDYVEPSEAPKPPTSPRGRPNGGGSPGTPTIKQDVLVDQVAKAA